MSKKVCFYCPEDIFQQGGGAIVARNILKNIPATEKVKIIFSKNTTVPDEIVNKHDIDRISYPKNNLFRVIFDLIISPFILIKYRSDRIICLNSLVPLLYPYRIEVFFQMRMFHFEEYDTIQKKIKNIWGVLSIRKSDYVYVASKDHKNDIVKNINVNPEKIIVTYLGFDFEYKKEELIDSSLAKEKYWLFISIFRPYKNLDGLIKSYGKLKGKYGKKVLPLYVIGEYKNNYKGIKIYKEEINALISKYRLENKVKFLGLVDHNIAMKYLANAELFVFPSKFEGFGLPILEAMALDIPVLSSDVHSLPEIGSNKIEYFSPDFENDLFNKLENIFLKGYKLDVGKAKERSKTFNWERTVKTILKVNETSYSRF